MTCFLCGEKFFGGPHSAELWVKHAEGMSQIKICDLCAKDLEENQRKTKHLFHDPLKTGEDI